jgi:activator of HSP90 ATPase
VQWSAAHDEVDSVALRFTVSEIFPVAPRAVYDAWLDGKRHGRMTGAAATGTARVGAPFTAWDGYIRGRNLELETGVRIVQSWRTTEFGDDDPDSKVTITLKPVEGGTKLILLHTNIPEGQTGYKQGWLDSYFVPMRDYFAKGRPSQARPNPRPKSRPSRP